MFIVTELDFLYYLILLHFGLRISTLRVLEPKGLNAPKFVKTILLTLHFVNPKKLMRKIPQLLRTVAASTIDGKCPKNFFFISAFCFV